MRQLIYMHIPKTGGSTVNSVFVRNLGESQCCVHLESSADRPIPLEARYLSGHLSYPEICTINSQAEPFIFTVLRNPVDQLYSHINWVAWVGADTSSEFFKAHSSAVQEASLRLCSIDLAKPSEFLRYIEGMNETERFLFDNCQTRYLSSMPRFSDAFMGDADFETAIDNASKFHYIGMTESLDISLQAVGRVIGVPIKLKDVSQENVMRYQLLDKIEFMQSIDLLDDTLLKYDNRLYAYAKAF